MFHRDKKHYVTAEIRKIPVAYLLNLEMTALDELEKRIEEEGKRSELARKWVAGLKRIKQTLKKGGGDGNVVNIFIVDILPKNEVFLKYNVRINARETSNFEQLICIDNFLQDILSKKLYILDYDREVRVTSRFS